MKPSKSDNMAANKKDRASLVTEVALAPQGAAHALNKTRKFYRDPPYGNLMFDPRVCRGSPLALSRATARQEAPRPPLAARTARGEGPDETDSRPLTPPPLYGRTHASVQTERYLEVLFDSPGTVEVECQTDLFMDRPSSPYYVNEKVGEDADTQIYPEDLWDFDRESHPMIEVLVGRTLELAMIEVLEEDEIENMKAQQRRFEELREGERAEQRRLEEQERRLHEEKERRIKQFKDAMKAQQETSDRIAAAILTQGYLADLLPNVLEGLTRAGYLLQDIRADMQEHVIPWLTEAAGRQSQAKVKVGDILTSVVRRIVEARALTYRLLAESEGAPPLPCVPPITPPAPPPSEVGSREYIRDMGPEERETPPTPDIPMKGTIVVRRKTVDRVPVPDGLEKPQESPEQPEPEPEPETVE